MCVRTKTSYGCGHSYKNDEKCHSSRCSGLERYHYMHEGDCRSCRSGGDVVTRGREGKGRYAQEIQRRSQVTERGPLQEVSQNTAPTLDASGGASPWAPQISRREKEWQSPTRKKADDAWLSEHEKRMEDLQTRLENLAGSSASSPRNARRESPERIIDENDDNDPYQSDGSAQRRRDAMAKNLQQEIRSINQDHYHRSSRRSDQHGSYDSTESLPHPVVYASPRRSKPSPRSNTYDQYELHDSAYGSYSSHRSHARTEPYVYSQSPRIYEAPVPSTAYGGVYQTGFGVEIYPRQSPQARQYTKRW